MTRLLCALALAAALAGCAKDPMRGVAEPFKAGNYEEGLAALERAKAEAPDSAEARYALFVVKRHLALQGEASQAEARLASAIEEYRWIAAKEGISPDFTDMEKTLKSTDKSRAAYEAAYRLVYSR